MFELRHLRALVAIRRRGSLAQAARDLYVTQSALSHSLRDLEDAVGSPLVHRKSKPLRFTAAGIRLLALADVVLPKVDEAEQDLLRSQRGQNRRLLLSMECHSCFEWLVPALTAFREVEPEVEVDVRIGLPFDPFPALKERVVDVIFSTDPTRDPDIHFFPLFRYESRLVVSPRHRLASQSHVEPDDLADETVITYPVPRERLDFFARFLHGAGVEPACVRHAELTMMIIQLVAGRQGVAALPSFAFGADEERGLVRGITLGRKGLWCDLWAAVRAEEAEESHVTAFVDLARKVSFAEFESRGLREIEPR